jgi:hypothetical protein
MGDGVKKDLGQPKAECDPTVGLNAVATEWELLLF